MRRRREALGISQGRLGRHLGLTFSQVQKYEKGTNRIGAGRLYQIATFLGVQPSYFFVGLDEAEAAADDPNAGAAQGRGLEPERGVRRHPRPRDPRVDPRAGDVAGRRSLRPRSAKLTGAPDDAVLPAALILLGFLADRGDRLIRPPRRALIGHNSWRFHWRRRAETRLAHGRTLGTR